MNEYHKIQSLYKRDPETKFKTLLEGEFSLPEFDYLSHNNWVFTEKVDGTNIRIKYQKDKIVFGGRTEAAQIPATLFERLTELFTEYAFDEMCLYGEGFGPKIQKGGGNYGKSQDFVLFDVKAGDIWLERENVEDIADQLAIKIVPIIGSGRLLDMVAKVRPGFTSMWGDFQAEGIVARPEVELKTRSGHRIITKLKCKDFK